MKTFIQITAGRGPIECCWVVAKVVKIFLEEVQQAGLSYTILQHIKGSENGTVQSVTISIEGKEAKPFIASWIGTIQWIGKSNYRKHHKRKNWFIGIYELQELQNTMMDEKEITFQIMKSSGPGGQHVNKVNSAVRAIYQPTGVSVIVRESRSQHQNKKIAIKRLQEKVMEEQLKRLQQSLNDQWENHLNIQRGNPIRIFKGTDFKKENKEKTFKNKRNQLKKELRNQLNKSHE